MPINPNSVKWDETPQIDESKIKWEDDTAEPSLGDITKGMGEAGLNFASGIPAALGGGMTYLGTLLASQNPDAAMHVKQATEKAINDKVQYEPRSKMGKQIQKDIGEGFEDIINIGGPSMQALVGAIPFVGEDLAKDNATGLDAIGKAYNEMAINVIDPMMAVEGAAAAGRVHRPLSVDHAAKIEPKVEPKVETPKINPAEVKWDTTAAHADDFAAMNPYDVGGHVTEAQQGRQSIIDNAQGDLFGSQTLEQSQTIPRVGQESLIHDTIPYEKTFPFDLEPMDQASRRGEMGLNMPEVDQQLSLVPKDGEVPRKQIITTKTGEQLHLEVHDNPTWGGGVVIAKNAHGEEVGALHFERMEEEDGTRHNPDIRVREDMRRQGVATALYDFAEQHGAKIPDVNQPGQFRSDYGQEFREARAGRVINSEFTPHMETTMEASMGEALRSRVFDDMQQHAQRRKSADMDAAYASRDAAKETDLNRMIAQRDLDFAQSIDNVNNSSARNFFTDPNNREKVVRPEDSRAKSFFLDPANRDKLDYHFGQNVMEDGSMMHPEHTQAMVDSLRRGDVKGTLDAIAKNHDNVAYRNLAEYLKDQLDGIKVRLHDEGILEIGDRHATGYYDPATRTVGLSRVGATSPHTVLHELVHAMTSDFVNSRPNDMRVLGVKDLFNKLNDMGMSKEFPEIINVKEFLAEAFSNPEFQEFLKDHKIQNRSTWRRFVDNVKSMLGFSSATRNHITDALEHVMDLGKQIAEAGKDDTKAQLTDAGMPGKLADLMVIKKQRPQASTTPEVNKLKIPALKDAISDFKFDDRPMSEIINEARSAEDIPSTFLEKMSHQLQAGGLFESLKTRNPVVKATYEHITRASQEYAREIKIYLTDPKTGLKAYMRALDPNEKGEIHAFMMLNEGQREFSSLELRQQGFNDRQIEYYNKAREQDNRFFDQMNQRRAELGMEPVDRRVAHMAGRFMGDFSRFVFDETGEKIVGRISGSTARELSKVTEHIQKEHPEWKMGNQEYNRLGGGKNPADRFQGLMEALNFITKTNSDASALMDSYKAYIQKDAIGYLNAVRHAKAKVKEAGGIIGSEGNKPWLDTVKNAEEGMKAQLAYFEQGYKWMAMEKAVHDLKPLLGDKEVALNQKNALEWSQAYVNHALGKQGVLADAVNWTASVLGEYSGLGHTNLFKLNNKVKHVMMQKFMGLMNIPFSLTQLMQPVQVHPPMVQLLRSRGLKLNPTEAQLKAVHTFFNARTGEKLRPLDIFEKQALDYAEKMGIMDVKMADHTKEINESPAFEAYSKIADFNIEVPEKLTRGTSFLFYSHLLKDAGVPVKDIFGAAENMTNMTMVNYHPIERPMGYAQLGWLGDLASTLTRYKHNQLSQAAFYAREGIHNGNAKSYMPLATFLATSLAFGGVMGFFGYQEADLAYQQASKFLGKPDSLTNVLFSHNTPELITHGLFSTIGLDMTSRFSNANVIPDSAGAALMPYGSAVLDMLGSTANLATDPMSTTRQKQFAKSMLPQSAAGLLENSLFTEKLPDGRNLYYNNTDGPNFGKGRVYRSDSDMAQRAFGFRDIRESKELAKNYSDSQINKAKSELAQGVLDKVKRDFLDGNLTPQKLQAYGNKAATQYDMDPGTFVNELVKWQQEHRLSQADQIKFRNALSGFTGAMRMKEGR